MMAANHCNKKKNSNNGWSVTAASKQQPKRPKGQQQKQPKDNSKNGQKDNSKNSQQTTAKTAKRTTTKTAKRQQQQQLPPYSNSISLWLL